MAVSGFAFKAENLYVLFNCISQVIILSLRLKHFLTSIVISSMNHRLFSSVYLFYLALYFDITSTTL